MHTMVGTAFGQRRGGAVGYVTSNLALAAVTMLVFRLAALAFQFRSASGLFDIRLSDIFRADCKALLKILAGGRSFALDGFAVQVATNFDVLVARNFLDPHASGLYLAETASSKPHLRGASPKQCVYPENRWSVQMIIPPNFKVIRCHGARDLRDNNRDLLLGTQLLPLWIFGADFRELSAAPRADGVECYIRYVGSLPGTALIAMKEQRKRIMSLSLTVLVGAIAVACLVLNLTPLGFTSWSLSLVPDDGDRAGGALLWFI